MHIDRRGGVSGLLFLAFSWLCALLPPPLIGQVRPQASLAHLDVFLRDLWMEPCCNHLSTFRINTKRFRDRILSDREGVGIGMGDADMGSTRLMDCLYVGLKFEYVYDTGCRNATIVDLKVEDEMFYPGELCYHTQWEGDPYMLSLSSTDPGAMIRVQPLPLKVVGRNRFPEYMCSHCCNLATFVCPSCLGTYWVPVPGGWQQRCIACLPVPACLCACQRAQHSTDWPHQWDVHAARVVALG